MKINYIIKSIVVGILIGVVFIISLKYIPKISNELIVPLGLSILWGLLSEKETNRRILSAVISFVISVVTALTVMGFLISSVWA